MIERAVNIPPILLEADGAPPTGAETIQGELNGPAVFEPPDADYALERGAYVGRIAAQQSRLRAARNLPRALRGAAVGLEQTILGELSAAEEALTAFETTWGEPSEAAVFEPIAREQLPVTDFIAVPMADDLFPGLTLSTVNDEAKPSATQLPPPASRQPIQLGQKQAVTPTPKPAQTRRLQQSRATDLPLAAPNRTVRATVPLPTPTTRRPQPQTPQTPQPPRISVRLGAPATGRELSLLAGDNDEALSWQERALCAQTDPEEFFQEKGGSTRQAKRVCLACEVREECLDYALRHDERFGVWGGLSERERRKLKKRSV